MRGEHMKAIVIYKSRTGYTEKYAQWIAQELGADLFPRSAVTPDILGAYNTVIYGGGLYAVGINGVKFVKDNLDKLRGKKVAVFACGCTPYREETVKEIRDKNFSPEEQEKIGFFYMRGGFDYQRLYPVDKILMTLLKLKLKVKKNRSPDEEGMLNIYARPTDFTRKQNIEALIEYVRS